MPVHYSLRENGTFVHVRATGRFTSGEINDFLTRLAADPDLQSEHVTCSTRPGRSRRPSRTSSSKRC